MLEEIKSKRLVDTNAEWVLYSGINDVPLAQREDFEKTFPGLEAERTSLYGLINQEGKRQWTPGSLKPSANAHAKKVLLCCLNDKPDGAASYEAIRTVLEKILKHYQTLKISNIASFYIGSGYGLLPDPVEALFGMKFHETKLDASVSQLNVELYS